MDNREKRIEFPTKVSKHHFAFVSDIVPFSRAVCV